MKKESVMTKKVTILIGANSEIAKALAKSVVNSNETELIVISRELSFYHQPIFDNSHLITIRSYSESNIIKSVNRISTICCHSVISQVYICHGMLHNQQCFPEKRLEDFNSASFNEVVAVNTITPMLWLKSLLTVFPTKDICKIVVFSARVGSISDNRSGGWYSYRASKAGLNMLLKSVAIEFSRRAKNLKLISFHPGTTDSPLSKPFQSNVPKGKLFTSDFVAQRLLDITHNTQVDGQLSYLDWQGRRIEW